MVQLQNKVAKEHLFIDAGVAYLRIRACDDDGREIENYVLSSNRDLREVISEYGLDSRLKAGAQVAITGKLAQLVKKALGGGQTFLQASALWRAAKNYVKAKNCDSVAFIEISASGYTLVGVDKDGKLREDLLVTNPRCGAGTGVNIDRVLQKLGMKREEVDVILKDYLTDAGQYLREKTGVRVDRCGVFGASATISDKNQGIPLSVALATTFKSELQKVITKLPYGFDSVVFVGRFFNWQFVRDCAEDFLREKGVSHVEYDPDNTLMLDALHDLSDMAGDVDFDALDSLRLPDPSLGKYPAFSKLKEELEANGHYRREPTPSMKVAAASDLASRPVHIGMDVGSTMAKVVMTDDTGQIVFLDAYSNAGDTIETVKQVFSDLKKQGLEGLKVRSIGVTGSARYQVREALARIYPQLASRLSVLVENYAHARGSIDQARAHLARLKDAGIEDLNEDFCILVDIGGEDTKISTLALREAELFNNAMNIKCSAGTGSLMDTLSSLFGIDGAAEASKLAFQADCGWEINATCAVFLIENAQKLQAQGVPRGEILASSSWAIVENMARTLWSQVELPSRTVALLHGQTMLSDPLPLAVTHRLESFLGEPAYCLVPPYPGHRACLGLIRTMLTSAPEGASDMPFDNFLNANFVKSIIQCKGAACSDPNALCNRTSLRCQGSDGKNFTFTLGGCSAINELLAKAAARKVSGEPKEKFAPPRDSYKEIWDYINDRLPRSEDPKKLIIPRAFIVSEWAYFFARFFERLGLPVYVDNVKEEDITAAQPFFEVDSCAPHMGAVGQFLRLTKEDYGVIVAPQIDTLNTDGKSLGKTCTLNQGGVATARAIAETQDSSARIHLLHMNLSVLDANVLATQLKDRIKYICDIYGIAPSFDEITSAAQGALDDHFALKTQTADLAADMIEQALSLGQKVALVVGREYLLNPGIYDSHVRRLLRDKTMVAIPSYVLDVELDDDFGHIYWRNPHFIISVLAAVAEKRLHKRIRQPRLAELFEKIETLPDLLPIVQVSTFCCGPDSVTLPFSAELMKHRPFLLIQSDAVLKELAHLENRVNTYVNQLNSGLHEKLLAKEDEAPFEMKALNDLEAASINKDTDVLYIPTLSDNRVLTSVMRAAGFTCIDNYDDNYDLQAIVKAGRRHVGDTVCAPLAGVYSDFERAKEDFTLRKQRNDPLVAGKTRLLFFDNVGQGPCRQGQYIQVHKLVAEKEMKRNVCDTPGYGIARFLIAQETQGYNVGIEEWALLRGYQAVILQGVLHDLRFTGALACSNFEEFEQFEKEYNALKKELFGLIEDFKGPGWFGRTMSSVFGQPAKYLAYRLNGSDLVGPVRRFAQKWKPKATAKKPLDILVTGEAYMRVAISESLYSTLLSILGLGRFKLHYAPLWCFFDYLIEQEEVNIKTTPITDEKAAEEKLKRVKQLRYALRELIVKPLYQAAGLDMPHSAQTYLETAKEVLPTLRPFGELSPYLGEVVDGLRHGVNLVINVAPTGCMVSTMSQVFTPKLQKVTGNSGYVQPLFSADGEVDEELLSIALLKSMGPEQLASRGV